MEQLQEVLVRQGTTGRIVSVSPGATRAARIDWDRLVGATAGGDGWNVVDRDETPIRAAELPSQVACRRGAPARRLLGLQAPGRDTTWFTVVAIPLDSGGALTSFVDVTELVQAHAVLERRASYDPLTGIANRALILERLAQALQRQQDLGAQVAVAFVDVDHLKAVNDTLGHEAGDELLCVVALRLRAALRPTDVVGRLGGDEFVVVMEQIETVEQALDVVGRLQQSVQQPVVVAGEQRLPQVSIGLRVARDCVDLAAVAAYNAVSASRRTAAGRSRCHLFEDGPSERLPLQRSRQPSEPVLRPAAPSA